MNTIRNVNIQDMFPAVVYRRGLAYFRDDLVSDLVYDLNYDVWTATVHGTEDYFVEINMKHFAQGSIEAYCDCPAFDSYGSCKHIVAVLISIANQREEETPGFVDYDYQTTNRFIQAIASARQSPEAKEILPQKVPMHVEYYLKWSYDRNLLVELKTGEKRRFVVKDAYEFLENVLHGHEHFFTKTFTYSPDSHYFLQQDLDVFERLFSVLENEQIYNGYTFYHFQSKTTDKRSIVVPPLVAKELIELLTQRDLTVEIGGQMFNHTDIVYNELPFHFGLTKNERDDLLLEMSNMKDGVYFKPYQILFAQGTFYFPAKEQVPVLEQISQIGMENHQLPITKNQADMFLSEVLPSLKKVGNVEIADKVASEITQVPLRAKLYLELRADLVIGKLEYHYGSYQIDPFGGQDTHDAIIIRDADKEQQIMQLIEYANFHYNGKELYIETEEEELYDLLYHVLPVLEGYVDLYLTSEIRSFIVENEPNPSTSVNVESASNLLDIGFNIDGVDDSEVNQILNAVIEKKRYYRLDSGALLPLEGEEFSSIKEFFDDLDIQKADLEDGNLHMPFYRSAQIDELIGTKKDYDPQFRQLLNHLKSPEDQVYEVPENLHASLRSYQETGYQWFKSLSSYHLGGILADDMGLGKTLQSIAYILSEPSDQPHLIVAPSSVLYNWKNEFTKFAPDLSAAILTGSPAEREEMIQTLTDQDVWITSYATLRQDIEQYRELTFQTMILDEAQYIKNYATKTAQAIRQIQAGRRFALSGTPIENSIDELWSIFQAVLPGFMPNQRAFKQMPNEKIASLTKPFILRRLKKDVLKELPDKIESVSVSELTSEQKELYLGYLRQLQQEAAASMKDGAFNQNRMKILAGLTRLRQICCHPGMFIENYQGTSGKLQQLLETLRNAVANGKRMLIFSQFTSMHEIIIEKLKEEGIDYFYLHGQTAARDRVEMSERFNEGEKNVFLISLKAGGTGLNLTGADTVILYDLWWNPAVEDQATGRAHRFGQKNVVQVIRLITEGTIEEKIYELQQKKRELIDQVIQPGETMLSSLSEDDVRELLSL